MSRRTVRLRVPYLLLSPGHRCTPFPLWLFFFLRYHAPLAQHTRTRTALNIQSRCKVMHEIFLFPTPIEIEVRQPRAPRWLCLSPSSRPIRYNARPVPSPAQRYRLRTSRLLWCCSPRSSGTRPRTWASALRITLLKLRCTAVVSTRFNSSRDQTINKTKTEQGFGLSWFQGVRRGGVGIWLT